MPDAPRAARRPTLAALERRDEFASRHIGPDDEDQRAMLATLGFAVAISTSTSLVMPLCRANPDGGSALTSLPALSTMDTVTCCAPR